ncbi:hypothetical protein [Rhizobium sp. 42MFCr.1]|uniref:hypothetical protein n=1 Tax=Rhizobium sp. 42MFCr.1 TaxID=1048680 RepID=UPI00035E9044|nr:hypothetical protein [Rhizobium sp. 42MFCr.1]
MREAIQNTLDALLDPNAPAIISFRFHQGDLLKRREYLAETVKFRGQAEFPVIEEWNQDKIDWVTIEDFNTRGLGGDLDDRLGDFWNYWLNFGVSNKEGAKRGGRGIGRVTFLIASRMQTVIGLTRRHVDKLRASCGMTLLKTMRVEPGGPVRTTHAYLANDVKGDIFDLHEAEEFDDGLAQAFCLDGYGSDPYRSGLALVIPYPHADLTADKVIAASIEHFAPAIINGSLVVKVDNVTIDAISIDGVASEHSDSIHAPAIRQDAQRYLDLIRAAGTSSFTLDVDLAKGVGALRESDTVKKMQEACEEGSPVPLTLNFLLKKGSASLHVTLKTVIAKTPEKALPIDRLFREGMSLPDVKSSAPGELDVVLLIDDENLATFLNLCEGKAHLDLLESKEVIAKLEKKGYHRPLQVKRFIKGLPSELRTLLTADVTEPDIDVFDAFFSLPDETSQTKKPRGGKPEVNPPPPPPPPPPRISPLVVETLDDGFRITANPEFAEWPVNLSITMAYADGSRKPAWSVYDFSPNDLETETQGCNPAFVNNKFTAQDCNASLKVAITGFDARRELDTHIKVWKHAQND